MGYYIPGQSWDFLVLGADGEVYLGHRYESGPLALHLRAGARVQSYIPVATTGYGVLFFMLGGPFVGATLQF